MTDIPALVALSALTEYEANHHSPPFTYDDGGRAGAGYKGYAAGDCACRAIAIATGLPYQHVYDLINSYGRRERRSKRKRGRSHARTGVYPDTMRRLMADLGWTWVATMDIGTGCQVHLCADELPPGRLIVRASKHFCAVIDGVIHDIENPSRDGTRCVYGYWYSEGNPS